MNKKNTVSKKEVTDLFYRILSGGPRVRLLESTIDLGLAELLYHHKEMSEADIIKHLEINPFRAEKWLYLLSQSNFLKYNSKLSTYSLGPILVKLVGNNKDAWWFFKEMIFSWQTVAYQDMIAMLQGSEVYKDINWPPKTDIDSISLEEWMSRTVISAISTLEAHVDFTNIKRLLDIGGGEGTMATTLAKKYSHLNITVFNLKLPCELAKKNIDNANVSSQVKTHEGNFLTDKDFPNGYDAIIFSRVLCDWPEEVCLKLFEMSYRALPKGGQFIICEPFRESNKALSLVWEYRYLFWDNFGKGVYKSYDKYVQMLKSVGFKPGFYSKPSEDGIYQVLISTKE